MAFIIGKDEVLHYKNTRLTIKHQLSLIIINYYQLSSIKLALLTSIIYNFNPDLTDFHNSCSDPGLITVHNIHKIMKRFSFTLSSQVCVVSFYYYHDISCSNYFMLLLLILRLNNLFNQYFFLSLFISYCFSLLCL